MLDILHRELVYPWYYFELQLRRIFPYWVLGMAVGSAISVFGKGTIHRQALSGHQKHLHRFRLRQ